MFLIPLIGIVQIKSVIIVFSVSTVVVQSVAATTVIRTAAGATGAATAAAAARCGNCHPGSLFNGQGQKAGPIVPHFRCITIRIMFL